MRNIFIIFFLVLGLNLFSQEYNFSSSLISSKDGLPDNNVNVIIQDYKGFMWFGTRNGLCNYDGFRMVNYFADAEQGLSHNYIRSLFETQDHLLWIGTYGGGLNVFNPISETFQSFDFLYADSIMVESAAFDTKLPDKIYYIISQKEGELWVATQYGLYQIIYEYDKQVVLTSVKRFKALRHGNSVCDNKLFHLNFDEEGKLWISSNEGGLSIYDIESNHFENYKQDDGKSNLPGNQIMFTYHDSKGNIWVGAWELGLLKFDKETKTFQQYQNTNEPESLCGNNIYKVCEDNNGNLWLGAIYSGLERLPLVNAEKPIFHHHWSESGKDNLISSNVILAINKSADGVIWVSTLGLGVYKIYSQKKYFNTISIDTRGNRLSGNDVTAISMDQDENIWVGTWGAGVNRLTKKNQRLQVEQFFLKSENPNSLSSNEVYAIISDTDNITWIGAWNDLNKVSYRNNNRVVFEKINFENPEFRDVTKKINTLHEDMDGVIWVGMENEGLSYVNPEKNALIRFREHEFFEAKHTLGNQRVNCLLSFKSEKDDVLKELWVGTFNGINRIFFYKDKIEVEKYFAEDKHVYLPGNDIRNFQKTDSILWIGTSSGMSFFNLNTNTFSKKILFQGQYVISILPDLKNNFWIGNLVGLIKYNKSSGQAKRIQDFEDDIIYGYNHNAAFIDKEGMCYFGTNSGLVYFYPDTIEYNYEPLVSFTDLKINHERIIPGSDAIGRVVLEKTIKETDHITLKHSDKVTSIEFASSSYHESEDNLFAYKLEGFSDSWTYTPIERAFVSLSNLPSGDYKLKVKAANKDNVWTKEPEVLNITVLPPVWRTWWAYLFYSIVLVSLFLLYRRITINRVKLQEAFKFEKFKREKEEELSKQRTQFFTNISHELRTPLTLIAGPLEQIINQNSNNNALVDQLQVIKNNSNKLLTLINQLLDFRKIELGKERLFASEHNIVDVSQKIYSMFEHGAFERNIDYLFNCNEKEIVAWFEQDKYEKILLNLLSNAFKYSTDNSKISIEILKRNSDQISNEKFDVIHGDLTSEELIEIRIKDTGLGMTKVEAENVFERFYRVKHKRKIVEGTGIGLSVVKELVLLHYGQIGVISEKDKGSCFIVRIPFGKKHLRHNEIVNKREEIPDPEKLDINVSITKASKDKKIIVVEDNKEMRKFIVDSLSPYYAILEAENGRVALDLLNNISPDLIVSDVMMPEMDGIEFCNAIKSNIETSHIPVILLTARSSVENNIEGFEAGADDYISKPFSPEVLLLRIRNRFETRSKLIKKFSSDIYSPTENLTSNPTDEKFLADFIQIIDQNLDNDNLDIPVIVEQFGMSKSTFTRKLKQLTNQSPADFINSYRMKFAARLILSKQYSMKEIAYKVGFSDSRYFSTRFKKHFKVTPTEYLNKKAE